MAEELRSASQTVRLMTWRPRVKVSSLRQPLLLRLSDPAMRAAVQILTSRGAAFIGPGAAVMERCYDKYQAYRIDRRSGRRG